MLDADGVEFLLDTWKEACLDGFGRWRCPV